MNSSPADRPVVASYCATFLKPEMLHIYRQICSLRRVRPVVITQKRENADRFRFEPVYRIGKPVTHFLRRFWFRQLRKQPWNISPTEIAAFRRVLDETDAALLHIYFGHIAVHLTPLIKSWPKPTVVSFHGADVLVELNNPAYRRATQEMLRLVRRIFVRSDSLRRALLGLTDDADKIAIMRTGIPLEEFPFRPRSSPDNGEWRLLQAGRLVEKKGLITSLRAFAEFVKSFPQARFVIAGDGPLLSELQALAHSLQVNDRVLFSGFVSQEQLQQLFYQSHIFLHPSQLAGDGNQEGVPNSMLEAMASGLPVFATNHGGIPEAISNGLTGILVNERDHTALGRELIKAAQQPGRLQQLGQAGSDSVARKFNQRAQTQRLEELYLQTVALS